ncbi:MAG: RluA family pseudouridine synthase [Pseudolabrys sp.]|nr:RluA family pseudouridine synthase [Pseudolabrys sp.]MCW5686235.1 RluA family pseudouridine synthase [Pseudolabrys sp.]
MKTSRPGSGKGSGRGGFDPHARKKTKRWRDVRKGEQGGRGGDDERRGGKPVSHKPSRSGASDERKFSGSRPGGRQSDERSFGPRKFESGKGASRSGERTFRDRKSVDREGGDRRPRDGKFGDRKPAGHKFDERPFRGERSGSKPAPRARGPRRDDGRGERFARHDRAERSFDGKRPDSGSTDRRPSHRNDRFDRAPRRDREAERHVVVSETAKPKELPTFESAGVQTVMVSGDEDGMRLDRFFEARFPGLSFSHIQRIIRKGEVRVNGKRAEPKARIARGQSVRIPPLKVEAPTPRGDAPADLRDRAFLREITLYEDDDVMVLNKPAGLAVQGGSGTTRHVDGMLGALQGQGRDAQRPRLVHRLDKDTAGCLLIAKTRFAAAALSKTFRSRSARKVYWALVYGVPKPLQGRVSNFLTKEQNEEDSVMRAARHGEEGASHAVTYYAVVETAAQQLAWVSLKPVTGRTHQLRAHMQQIGNPILGDPKYFDIENWKLPGGIQNKLHLLARRIAVPHPRGGRIDVTAPLPPHMQQTWNLIGLDMTRYDPIEDAPEE